MYHIPPVFGMSTRGREAKVRDADEIAGHPHASASIATVPAPKVPDGQLNGNRHPSSKEKTAPLRG